MKMSKLIKNMIWPIIILSVLLAIVYYRAVLFTKDFNSPIDSAVNEASESLDVKIPAHKLAENEKPLFSQLFGENKDETGEVSYEVVSVEVKTLDEPEKIAVDNEVESQSNSGVDEIVSAVKETVTETVNEALALFKEENQQELASQLVAPQSVSSQSVLTESEMLFKARLAYWNHDLKTAEDTYLALTKIADDPNAYGELGNVYYMQSKWKKASEAYYQAAIKLKSMNQVDQAYHLLRIIRGLDSITANKLQSALEQSS